MGILSYFRDSAKLIEKLIEVKEIFLSTLSLINTKTTNKIDTETFEKLITEQIRIVSSISNDMEKMKKTIEKIEIMLYAVITINIITLTFFIVLLLR